VVVLVFSTVLAADAHGGESTPQVWEPGKTWVFAVSLARFQGDRLHAFDPAERIDGDFEALFAKRGVPPSQIVFLKDEQGTTERIRAAFERLLSQTRPGDFLYFYFGSHGSYDPQKGEYAFSTYDGHISYDWSVDEIETRFRGSHALLATDCCHSGGIVDVVKRRPRPNVAYACLSSMYSHSSGSNVWRFMRCLMRGLAGDPRQDLDGDGAVELDELALDARRELSFLRETSPMFFTTERFDSRLRLSKVSGPVSRAASREVGRHVLVRAGEAWRKATTEADKGNQIEVRYGDNDRLEWVTADRLQPFRPIPPHPKGARVWMHSTGCSGELWHPATVRDSWETLHLCQPDGYSQAYDEWVGPNGFAGAATGTWSGRYANSTGERNDTSLQLDEADDGTMSGQWDGVRLEGARIGGLVLSLAGNTPQRSYRLVVRMHGNLLLGSYTARRPDGSQYFGRFNAARSGPATEAAAPRDVKFLGKWAGTYVNTKRQGGQETLELNQDANGGLSGLWTDGVKLRGELVGHDAIYLAGQTGSGQTGSRSYSIVGLMETGELHLYYATHGQNRERYYGMSTLRSAKPR
jgi:hypothetical protein